MIRLARILFTRSYDTPFVLLCCVSLVLIFSCPSRGSSAETPNVLILHSYHQGHVWTDHIMSGIESAFAEANMNAEFHVEYMDTKRHYASDFSPLLKTLYEQRYKGTQFDLILLSDNSALNFVLLYGEDIFHGAPVVFSGINNFQDSMIAGRNKITGVAEDIDIGKTIELALKIHPALKKIVVINDRTPTGIQNQERLEKEILSFKEKVDFISLIDLTIDELLERVHDLPSDTVILLFTFHRDRSGRVLSLEEFAPMITGSANVPVYSMWETSLGYGILGGIVENGIIQGQKAAEAGIRILHGEAPEHIPVILKLPNQPMFDYIQLKRFGISHSLLPDNSIVINRPMNFYEEHRNYVLLFITSVTSLFVVILVLTRNITRRIRAEDKLKSAHDHLEQKVEERTSELHQSNFALQKDITVRKKAEEALRISEAQFRDAFQYSSIGIALVSPDGSWKRVNPSLCNIAGYSREELLSLTFQDITHPDDLEADLECVRRMLSGEIQFYRMQKRYIRKDGQIVWIHLSVSLVRDEKGAPLHFVSQIQDITAQKTAKEELEREIKLRHVLLDNLPCIALILKNGSREIVAVNEVARQAGAAPGKTCFQTCAHLDYPCPFCEAPAVWSTGQGRHREVEHMGRYYDGYWIPYGEDLYVHYIFDITDRKTLEDKIRASLEEKEVLLREIHHRVKNNFQSITSLLRLQSQAIKDQGLRQLFTDSENRIKSMSLVHEMLYRSGDLARIDFSLYIRNLTKNLSRTYRLASNRVRILINIEPVTIDIELAIYLGLIINELVSNAMKHAFPGDRAGNIFIGMHKIDGEERYELTVRDDGIGISSDLNMDTAETLGLRLVSILVKKQLEGTLTRVSDAGTEYRINIAKPLKKVPAAP